MALRSLDYSFFRMGYFSNPLLLSMVLAVVTLQAAVVYLPSLQSIFRTVLLTFESLAWVTVPGIAVFAVLELEKIVAKARLGNDRKALRHV